MFHKGDCNKLPQLVFVVYTEVQIMIKGALKLFQSTRPDDYSYILHEGYVHTVTVVLSAFEKSSLASPA